MLSERKSPFPEGTVINPIRLNGDEFPFYINEKGDIEILLRKNTAWALRELAEAAEESIRRFEQAQEEAKCA